jgi:hypothetical protein
VGWLLWVRAVVGYGAACCAKFGAVLKCCTLWAAHCAKFGAVLKCSTLWATHCAKFGAVVKYIVKISNNSKFCSLNTDFSEIIAITQNFAHFCSLLSSSYACCAKFGAISKCCTLCATHCAKFGAVVKYIVKISNNSKFCSLNTDFSEIIAITQNFAHSTPASRSSWSRAACSRSSRSTSSKYLRINSSSFFSRVRSPASDSR